MLVPRKRLQTCLFLYETVIFHSPTRKTAALKRILCWINMRGFSVSLLLSMYRAVAVTWGLRDGARSLWDKLLWLGPGIWWMRLHGPACPVMSPAISGLPPPFKAGRAFLSCSGRYVKQELNNMSFPYFNRMRIPELWAWISFKKRGNMKGFAW